MEKNQTRLDHQTLILQMYKVKLELSQVVPEVVFLNVALTSV